MMLRRAFLTTFPAAALTATTLTGCATPPYGGLADFPRAPRTPALPNHTLSRIAFTSCANEDEPTPLYDSVRLARPDLLVMLGDNVYGSDRPDDPALPDLRAAYQVMSQNRSFQELVRSVPTLAIWDDHDYGKNDGGGDFAYKQLAQKMFNRFWNIPAQDPRQHRAGTYFAVTLGPQGRRVQIIGLDTRSFRDPLIPSAAPMTPGRERYDPYTDDAQADVLGAAQWQFLASELAKPADVRVICTSIQLLAEGHGWERWGNFPAARRRFYRLIAETGAQGVVLVSGDRHYGSIHSVAGQTPYPLFELTASSVNRGYRTRPGTDWPDEVSSTRIGPGYGPVNFGQLVVDWAQQRLSLELRNLQGGLAQTQTIDLDALHVPGRK